MKRLLCVPNPHVRLDRRWAAPYVPLELLSAMGTAEAVGAEPALFDVNRLVEHGRLAVGPGLWARAARLLAEAEPELVLFESWTSSLHNSLQLAAEARALLPGVPFVLGGAGSSALAAEVLARFPALDGVIRGELEPAVEALARAGAGALPAAPGLVRRTPAGVQDADAAWVAELACLPRPAYHLALLAPGEAVPVETGRGCTRGCSYCALAGHWRARYRARPAEAIAAEMAGLAAHHPGALLDLTQDAELFAAPGRARGLCAALRGVPARWTCLARLDQLEDADLRAMAAAGCAGVLFGVESGSRAGQAASGKGVRLDQVLPGVHRAVDQGLQVRCTFVLGWPGEEPGELAETLALAQAARRAGAEETPLEPLRAYPGSAIHRAHAARLVLEPLLCSAAPEDVTGRTLIEGWPALFSESCRVPTELPRGLLLGAWVAASALPGALACILPAEALPALELDPVPARLERAVEVLGAQLAAPGSPALADLVAYEQAAFAAGREDTAEEPAGPEELLGLARDPTRAVPQWTAPHRLLASRTALEQLLEPALPPPLEPAALEHLLLAKVCAPGEASFYTRRAYSVETFRLGELAAALLPLIDGRTPLGELASRAAAALGREPAEALEAAEELVRELLEEGVLGVVCDPPGRDAQDA